MTVQFRRERKRKYRIVIYLALFSSMMMIIARIDWMLTVITNSTGSRDNSSVTFLGHQTRILIHQKDFCSEITDKVISTSRQCTNLVRRLEEYLLKTRNIAQNDETFRGLFGKI